MKRMTKKLGAIVLALAMCLSLCCTALAASSTDTDFSITISNSIVGSTYNAYKIFNVTYDDNGNISYTVESTSNWYILFSGTVTDDEGNTIACPFKFTATTGQASEGVTIYNVTIGTKDDGSVYEDDEIIDYLNAAIKTVASYDDGTWTGLGTGYGYAGTASGNGGSVTIELEEPGYYFVTTTTGSIVSITTADPDATIIDKQTPPPDIEKVIVHDDSDDTLAEADGMGEDVTFDVTATAPITEDDNYVVDYKITDTMTNGLLIELEDGDFYQGSDGKYYLYDEKINEWIKLYAYDGATATVGDFTDYVYNYSFELVGYDTYTDEITGEEVHTFSGFVLTYYTYNVDLYKTNLRTALTEQFGQDAMSTIWPDGEEWPTLTPEQEAVFDFDSESYFEEYSADNQVGTVYPANAQLVIEYTAHVSSLEGYENTNTIYLDHDVTPFNHPTPWNPTPGPQQFARDYVYSWELQILKVDGEDKVTPLEGATFTLESNNMKDVKIGHSYLYVPLSLFDNGVYTDDEGNEYEFVDFESTHYIKSGDTYVVGEGSSNDDTYVRILTSDASVEDTTTTHSVTATTDEYGMLYFEGLGTGVFTLTEITAPDGYNLLTDPIIFQISFNETGDETTGYEGHFTVTYGTLDDDGNFVPNSGDNGSGLEDNYILVETIENSTGTELPGTGGIGTTIFYIIGGVLVVGAVVVLVTRRRMTREG